MSGARVEAISAWARAKIGCGYVYGATGWVCSAARRVAQAAQYPEYKDTILGVCAKWDGVQCFDCAQLTRFALQQAGVTLKSGATSQWRQGGVWARGGEIASVPRGRLCVLWRARSASVMQHVGLLLEDGTVIDARGSASGVVTGTLGSYAWTHWAIPAGLYEDETGEGGTDMNEVLFYAQVRSENGKGVNLRKGPGASYARVSALPTVAEGTQVAVLEETSATYWRIRVGDAQGYAATAYLQRLDAQDGAEENAGDSGDKVELTLEITLEDAKALFAQLKGVLEG